ncbi:MAG: transposase [Planctomycetota bacterium]
MSWFPEDSRISIDNNDTERDLRSLSTGRKNWLFTRKAISLSFRDLRRRGDCTGVRSVTDR